MMTDGEVVADGNVIVLQVFVEHVVHIGKVTIWTLVLREMAHDDAFQFWKDTSDFHLVEHAVDLGHSFASIFEEEY